MNKCKFSALLIVAFLMLISACDSPGDPPKNPQGFKRSVLTTVDVGQPLAVAQRALEAEGFLIRDPVRAGLFGDMAFDPATIHEPIDYVPFWRGHKDGTWSWIVALVYEDTSVQLKALEQQLVRNYTFFIFSIIFCK